MKNKTRNIQRGVAILALFIVVLIGCETARYYVSRHQGMAFNHQIHVKQGMDCMDCHVLGSPGVEKSRSQKVEKSGSQGTEKLQTSNTQSSYHLSDMGMPDFGTCRDCHMDIDAKKPQSQHVTHFLDKEGKITWSSVTRLPSDVKFSHTTHLGAKISCETCHKGIKKSTAVSSKLRVTMNNCLACHREKSRSRGVEKSGSQGAEKLQAQNYTLGTSCATCHTKMNRETPPNTHNRYWKKFHGQVVRTGDTSKTANNCKVCHTSEACTRCHQQEPPENHNNFWRIRGHTVMARIDRENCATCHREDFCNRCHQDTSPMSHVGTWGSPRDTHCLGCHFPLSSQEQCLVCHKGTPSHQEAAPKPAWHNAGFNCRQCHGAGQPLPHVDKGDDCNACHQ